MKDRNAYIAIALSICALVIFNQWGTSLSIAYFTTNQTYDFNDGTYQEWTPGRDTFVSYGEIKMLYGGSGVELSKTYDFSQATSGALSWRNKISSAYLGVYVNDVLIASLTSPVGSWDGNGLAITEYIKGKSNVKISFKPIGGSGYLYLDDIKLSVDWKSSVSLSADVNQDGYPYNQVAIPIHAVDNFGNPLGNLLIQYEFTVGEWYQSNTVLTDATGEAIIELEPDESGTGTLSLYAVYGGATASSTVTVDLHSYLSATISSDSIQYLNEPIKATIQVKENGETPIDPERLKVEATVSGIAITGTLSKREVGVYEWSSNSLQVGRLSLKATPEKAGYFSNPGTGEIDLKQPRILFEHNLPENVNQGSSLSVVVKIYTPQKSLMDPSTITATMRDPFDVAHPVTLSKISTGMYGFTYKFDDEGLYYLNVEASAPKFEATILKATVNVSAAASNPAGDVTAGIFTSPVTLALVAVGVVLAVVRFWRGRR